MNRLELGTEWGQNLKKTIMLTGPLMLDKLHAPESSEHINKGPGRYTKGERGSVIRQDAAAAVAEYDTPLSFICVCWPHWKLAPNIDSDTLAISGVTKRVKGEGEQTFNPSV